MKTTNIFKFILLVAVVVINALLYIVSIFGFLFFFGSIATGNVQTMLITFLVGFGGLFLGTVVYDCNVIIFKKVFK